MADRAGQASSTRRAGSSSSPTCSATGCRPRRPTRTDYPTLVTIHDNVQAQRRALHDAVRDRARGLRLWLVDGCAAGLSLGRAVPRRGGAHRGQLRRRPHRGAQPGVPALADGDAGGCAAAYRQWPLLRRTARREAGVRPDLRRLGAQPGFLSRRPASGGRPAAQPRRAGSGDLPARPTGRSGSAPAPPPTFMPSFAPGTRRHQRQRAVRRRSGHAPCGRSRRACC